MGGFRDLFASLAAKVVTRFMGSGLAQEETEAAGEKAVFPGMPPLLRRAAADGCVLLKNDGTLPLSGSDPIAVFGRHQTDWFCVGYGSGGDVHAPYAYSLTDALEEGGYPFDRTVGNSYRAWTEEEQNRAKKGWWGHWPFSHPERPLTPEFVKEAAGRCRTAVVVLGRAAGEDRDLVRLPGSFLLTPEETKMLDLVTESFEHTVVVLNCGSLPDMSWVPQYGDGISALLVAWMGGMESGRALCDVLYGKVCPSGRLPDTIPLSYEKHPGVLRFGRKDRTEYGEDVFLGYRHYDRCPEQVLYPFGFGLSYTYFSVSPVSLQRGEVSVRVRNGGDVPGKEAVLLFCAQPEGSIRKPRRVLVAFAKTDMLAPGGETVLTLVFDDLLLSSYDTERHAYVLEQGNYRFTANGVPVGELTLEEETVRVCEPLAVSSKELKERILNHLPAKEPEEQKELLDRLSDAELEALTRGHGMMNSPLGVPGNAGVFGGVLPSLRDKGIPPVVCCDGPAGIRMAGYSSLLPSGTCLASSWDISLVEEIGFLTGKEMEEKGVDVLLAPGMNLHRSPLCGRNFEYYSEDPVLSGKTAAAMVRGIQKAGKAACPKHFACNHQEYRRNVHDARLSERALRELYLRNFEICVRESAPLTLMTSYNKVNGVWSHYHYDLVTTVLRREWNYEGMVMTDWWMKKAASPEFPYLKNNAYRIRAQVDLLMPGAFSHFARKSRTDRHVLRALKREDGLTKGELRRCAGNVLRTVFRLRGEQ